MTEYIRKPLTVTAIQWAGDNFGEVREFTHPARLSRCGDAISVDRLGLPTRFAYSGGWVIKSGDAFQTMSDREFRETFERVGGGDDD